MKSYCHKCSYYNDWSHVTETCNKKIVTEEFIYNPYNNLIEQGNQRNIKLSENKDGNCIYYEKSLFYKIIDYFLLKFNILGDD